MTAELLLVAGVTLERGEEGLLMMDDAAVVAKGGVTTIEEGVVVVVVVTMMTGEVTAARASKGPAPGASMGIVGFGTAVGIGVIPTVGAVVGEGADRTETVETMG